MGRRGCLLCGSWRPSVRVGGGPGSMICRKCRRLPQQERQRRLLLAEILDFLKQSNISKKNIKRLSKLEADVISEVTTLASLVKRIALVKPGRRRRWKWLWRHERELLREAVNARLIDPLPPRDQEPEDYFEWSPENDYLEDYFELENIESVWITPRPYECEPSSAAIRQASGRRY